VEFLKHKHNTQMWPPPAQYNLAGRRLESHGPNHTW